MIKKIINRYKVSEEIKRGLDFFDLPVRLSNGQSTVLHVNANEFIPLDLLDERDVKLSEHSGCIFRALNSGWIIDITKPITTKKTEEQNLSTKSKQSQKSNYKLVETISPEEFSKMRDKTGLVETIDTSKPHSSLEVDIIKFENSMPQEKAVVSTAEGDIAVVTPEKRKDLEEINQGSAENIQNISSNGYGANSFTEFNRLKHFAKLDVIKHSNNLEMLKDVVQNSNQKQIINNAKGRIRELETQNK